MKHIVRETQLRWHCEKPERAIFPGFSCDCYVRAIIMVIVPFDLTIIIVPVLVVLFVLII